ncbi:MAG: cation transporter [Erysipelotrichaceae bacterium]|nr:cation transporter [Erysipelotrichaceae bacterium]
MVKTYILNDLDCAACASKIEANIIKIKGVKNVNVNFLSGKIEIDASEDDHEDIFKAAKKIVKRFEPDVELVVG